MTLPPKRLSPVSLAEAVDRALGCAEGAARVKAGYEATGGARTAADAIEKLAVEASTAGTAGAFSKMHA